MANTKKTKAPKKSAKSAPKKAKAPALAAALEGTLTALPAEYERPIDVPVSQVLQEARELEEILKLHGETLSEKSDLEATPSAVKARRAALETTENLWFGFRVALTPEERRQTRQSAEELRRDMVAALRFFSRKDQEVQHKVSAIQEGNSFADLLDDLVKLADLTEALQASLAKAEYPDKLGPLGASNLARSLAETLGASAAAEKASPDAAKAIAIRNRAFWHLREMMDEIRAAGRYVFRKKPKLLTLFHGSRTSDRFKPKAEPASPPTNA